MYAAKYNRLDVLELLVKQGAELKKESEKDGLQWTILKDLMIKRP